MPGRELCSGCVNYFIQKLFSLSAFPISRADWTILVMEHGVANERGKREKKRRLHGSLLHKVQAMGLSCLWSFSSLYQFCFCYDYCFESKPFLIKPVFHISETVSELTLRKQDHFVMLLLSMIIPAKYGKVFPHILNFSE